MFVVSYLVFWSCREYIWIWRRRWAKRAESVSPEPDKQSEKELKIETKGKAV